MKFLKAKLVVMIFSSVLLALMFGSISVFAETVGQQLTAPESGWQRIDDGDNRINYSSEWDKSPSWSAYWLETTHFLAKGLDGSLSFKFNGTKFRIITQMCNQNDPNVLIEVDGVTQNPMSLYNSNINPPAGCQVLVYELTGLENDIHTVTISKTSNSNYYVCIDAIDIDETGYLIDDNQPVNLTGSAIGSTSILKWEAVDGATSYNVKWSSTPGGKYTTLNSVKTTSYTDTEIKIDETRYYVVTAIVNGVESRNSNEVAVTIHYSPEIAEKAILNLYLDDGIVKEYDLNSIELNDFLTWYNKRSETTNTKAYYIMKQKVNISPYLSIKDYIPYNKILYFVVKEY